MFSRVPNHDSWAGGPFFAAENGGFAGTTPHVDKSIDARGSYCPGPLMELIKAIKNQPVGAVVEVLSSDQGSSKDIPEWVQKTGHELVYSQNAGDHWRIAVRKKK